MNWRQHLRMIALIANILMVLSLIGFRGWWYPMVLGVPMIVPPVLAIIALALRVREFER
jgi:hypothetical protein